MTAALPTIRAIHTTIGGNAISTLLALILACALSVPLAASAQKPVERSLAAATDLATEAKQAFAQDKAYVVLFSETGCMWCERARQEFLLPMQDDPQLRTKAVFRQINVDRDEPLRDFNGRASTHRRFARAEGVRLYPTIALYMPDGKPAAEKLTGFTSAVYYGSSIERRIDSARANMAAARTGTTAPN